jgi:hypothetical protein
MDEYPTQTTNAPIFKVGDKVKFEVARATNHARWNYSFPNSANLDLGASGIWATGVVVEPEEYLGKNRANLKQLSREWIYVRYSIAGMIGDGYSIWPLKECGYYRNYQWSRPGFLKHVAKCVCGSEAIYGKGTNLHSFWCEMKQEENNKK